MMPHRASQTRRRSRSTFIHPVRDAELPCRAFRAAPLSLPPTIRATLRRWISASLPAPRPLDARSKSPAPSLLHSRPAPPRPSGWADNFLWRVFVPAAGAGWEFDAIRVRTLVPSVACSKCVALGCYTQVSENNGVLGFVACSAGKEVPTCARPRTRIAPLCYTATLLQNLKRYINQYVACSANIRFALHGCYISQTFKEINALALSAPNKLGGR